MNQKHNDIIQKERMKITNEFNKFIYDICLQKFQKSNLDYIESKNIFYAILYQFENPQLLNKITGVFKNNNYKNCNAFYFKNNFFYSQCSTIRNNPHIGNDNLFICDRCVRNEKEEKCLIINIREQDLIQLKDTYYLNLK